MFQCVYNVKSIVEYLSTNSIDNQVDIELALKKHTPIIQMRKYSKITILVLILTLWKFVMRGHIMKIEVVSVVVCVYCLKIAIPRSSH